MELKIQIVLHAILLHKFLQHHLENARSVILRVKPVKEFIKLIVLAAMHL